MKKIIGIIACVMGIGTSIYLSYLYGTMYTKNQGVITCACFIGFCSTYFLIQILAKMRRERRDT